MGETSEKSRRRTAAASAARYKGAKGGRRGDIQEQRMLDQVMFGLASNMTLQQLCVAMADEFGRPRGTPIPIGTMNDYAARATEQFRKMNEDHRRDTMTKQRFRLYRDMRQLRVKGEFKSVARLEWIVMKIEGNEAPRQVVASTAPGKPIEVKVMDPRKLSHGARQRRIAELASRNAAAAIVSAVEAAAGEATAPAGPAVEEPEQKTTEA